MCSGVIPVIINKQKGEGESAKGEHVERKNELARTQRHECIRTATSSNYLYPKVSNPCGDKRIIILLGVKVLSHRLRSVRFCQGPVESYGCHSVGVGSEQYSVGAKAVS